MERRLEDVCEVKDVKIPRDRDTGKGKGFGFVALSADSDTAKAQDAINSLMLHGRILNATPSKTQRTNAESTTHGQSPKSVSIALNKQMTSSQNTAEILHPKL